MFKKLEHIYVILQPCLKSEVDSIESAKRRAHKQLVNVETSFLSRDIISHTKQLKQLQLQRSRASIYVYT